MPNASIMERKFVIYCQFYSQLKNIQIESHFLMKADRVYGSVAN